MPSLQLQRLESLADKAVYLSSMSQPLLEVLSDKVRCCDSVAQADVVLVLDAGDWTNDEQVLADINAARNAGKPWMLLRFGVVDLFASISTTTQRRRVRRSY